MNHIYLQYLLGYKWMDGKMLKKILLNKKKEKQQQQIE